MDKLTWRKVYRGARIVASALRRSQIDNIRDGVSHDNVAWAGYEAYFQADKFFRICARMVTETRLNRPALPIVIMRRAIKRAKLKGTHPIEIYWELQPVRFDSRRLP